MIWLAVVLAASPDAGRVCKRPGAETAVKVSFKAGAKVEDLARFASAVLCEPWEVAAASQNRTLRLSVDGQVYGRQLPVLFGLLTESADVVRVAPVKDPPPLPPPKATCNPRLLSSIVPIDPWTRRVPTASKGALLECAPTQLRIIPHFHNGAARGFKLFSIREGSLADALAFQNGDIVLAVNDAQLSSLDQALEAYAKVQEASALKFSIVRKGAPRTITWLFR